MTYSADRLGVFDEDLAIGRIVFVIATRPIRPLEVEFQPFEVGGLERPLSFPGELPGDQGLWIDIGAFPIGVEIEVRWRFRTGSRVPDDDVVIGYCPNFRLTRLVRLEHKALEPFRDYEGSFRAVPQKP